MSILSDMLEEAGGILDKPGRAVRGLLGGHANEGLAFLPFSDAAGITDPSQQVSGQDLARQWFGSTGSETGDAALGFGVNLATDPLTYAGGFLGRLGGRSLGRGLEAAASARGPGYATTAEDILQGIAHASPTPMPEAERFMQAFGMSPRTLLPKDAMRTLDYINDVAPQSLSEIPHGSQFLGAGVEGMAFRTPAGDVVRVGSSKVGAPGRPVSNLTLQPTRTVDYSVPGSLDETMRVERTPLATGVNSPLLQENSIPAWGRMSDTTLPEVISGSATGATHPHLFVSPEQRLVEDARLEGMNFWDTHGGNMGYVDGQPKIIDPGAVTLPRDAAHAAEMGVDGMFQGPFAPVTQSAQPGMLTRTILDVLGGHKATRRAIDAGFNAPGYQRGFGAAGTLLGSLLGST